MNLVAGGSLGALVGLLLGLSTSPTVSATVGSLIALVVAFLGLGGSVGPVRADADSGRVLSFSVAMALAVLAGVAIRTHALLSPPVRERVQLWRAAGYPDARARDLAAFEITGLLPAGATRAPEGGTPSTQTMLFADEGAGDCSVLEADRFASPQDRLRAMVNSGKPWTALQAAAAGASPDRLSALLDGAWTIVCEDRAASR